MKPEAAAVAAAAAAAMAKPNTDKKLNVRISMVITDGDKPYFEQTLNYSDVPYGMVVQMERVGAEAINQLVALGEAAAAA